ncbi:MAG TPA: VWA domain-containing protein, partial [Polyangiaceae bacterium]
MKQAVDRLVRAANVDRGSFTSTPRRRKSLRLIILALVTLLGVGLAAAYPLGSRSDELLHASWQNRWFLLALLLVPMVFWRGTFGEDRRTPRLRMGTLLPFASGPSGWRVWLRDTPGALRAVGLAMLVLAMARPTNTLRPQTASEEGIDMVVALDLSGSMRAVMENLPESLSQYVPPHQRGTQPTRFEAARAVLRDFIARRKTDRIGVVVFAVDAYVLSPPTLDYHLLDSLVSRME